MGDTAVDFFLETLNNLETSSKLDFIIDDEKHQLRSLAEEIKYLRGFLKITEKKRNEHSEVMDLVMRIGNVTFVAENEVERWVVNGFKAYHTSDYLRELGGLTITGQYAVLHRFSSFMVRYFCFLGVEEPQYNPHIWLPCKHQRSLHLECVKKVIKNLRVEVKQILDDNMYDINGVAVKKLKHSSARNGGGSGSSGRSNPSKVVEEKVVVGFKEEVKTLMRKLHDSGEDGPLEIISIVGAAGGGKTTLAREVYDQRLTLESFEIRAWVVVSQEYDKNMKKDLLIRILESAFPKNHVEYEKGNEDMLGENLLKCLKGKKYLIVMDDIWGIEAWNDIQRSFPRERRGSKVVFTSRLLVQFDSICCIPHYLVPLPKSCSWELLEKKVFGMKRCPPELADIGKQIAGKCEGLPLAIVAIGGILATEHKTLDVWEEVAKHLSSIIAKNQEGCMEILELSYNHLPLHLKACFLYIGAHPKDSEIPLRELICLWIAEGFIQQSARGESLEAIAEDYLNGLVDRSLVMVARKSKSHGGIKACHMHDLLRELCLIKAEEDNFFVKNYEGDSLSPLTELRICRRLFMDTHMLSYKFPLVCRVRSYLCLSLAKSMANDTDHNLSCLVGDFELLRVLHLSPIECRREVGIGHLVHLRYLALSLPHEPPKWAPYVFYYLSNLETFILHKSPSIIPLPPDIVKMVKLRHLYTKRGRFEYHHVSDDEEEGNMLDSLQTLHRMCICLRCLRFLERTPNLRKLGFKGYDLDIEEDDALMLPDLDFLKHLETLDISGWEQGAPVERTGLKLPRTLTRLSLCSTFLEWEELSIILQTLTSLEVLKLLKHACVGPVWNTSELEEGFSQLKYLRLEYLDIEEWSASKDEFPTLEVLVVRHCRKLQGIPIDFANLYDLREINVMLSSQSADESAREIQEKQRNTKGDDDCLNLLTRENRW